MANRLTRRVALKSVGALASAPWVMRCAVGGGNSDRGSVRVGLIGVGMRGKYLLANLPAAFRVTALCDCSLDQVDSARHPKGRFSKILRGFAETDGRRCEVYQDYRVMLRRQEFDAIIIAAPDHHHAGAAILAMQAGADVYVEKPLAVTIAESRAIVQAARKYDRIVQVGSQQRTMEVNQRACIFLRDGGLGKISVVEVQNYPGPMPIVAEEFPRETVPESLDWDLFCGPVPIPSYNRRLWMKDAFDFGYLQWRGWDLFQPFSGHLMTNWGAHSIDMVQFALGKDDSGPVEIDLHPKQIDDFIDDQWHHKTPPLGALKDKETDKMRFCPVTMKYADGTQLQFKPGVRKTVFHGEKGKLFLSRNDYRTEPEQLLPPPRKEEKERWAGDGHVARPHLENWEQAIRSRQMPNAPPEVGHRSITVCHLANIARTLGQKLVWDPTREQFEHPSHNSLLTRRRRSGFELPKV